MKDTARRSWSMCVETKKKSPGMSLGHLWLQVHGPGTCIGQVRLGIMCLTRQRECDVIRGPVFAMCGPLWHRASRVAHGPTSVFSSPSCMRWGMCCISCPAWISSAAGRAQATLSTQDLISMPSSVYFSTQLPHPLLIPLHLHVSFTFPDSLLFSTLFFFPLYFFLFTLLKIRKVFFYVLW